MADVLTRCLSCSKWTNYGINCVNCSPKALDKTSSRDEESDPYYDEYRQSENFSDEYYDEDELDD